MDPRPAASRRYGVVVDSVKVRAFEYVPVRSGSVLLMSCDMPMVTESLETGAVHEDFESVMVNGCARAKEPLTSLLVLVVLGSDQLSAASPAEEMTLAVVEAVYVRVTPGVNEPSWMAGPSVRASVAGTVPLTPPLVLVAVSTV